jgi:hypothetical protein
MTTTGCGSAAIPPCHTSKAHAVHTVQGSSTHFLPPDWSNPKPYCLLGCGVQLEQQSGFFARTSNWQLQLLQCWHLYC